VRIDARHDSRFIGRPLVSKPDALRDAWCGMVQEHMTGDGDVFLTGTYSDSYGYAHGLMKSHNVMKDVRRFLLAQNLDSHAWVAAVELHKFRDILHVHMLLAGVGGFEDRVALERAWRQSGRGQQVSADPLLDRGISYCTKYALKGQNAADFDWSWS